MTPLDAQGQFRELLGKWEVKHADTIAEFVAAQGENALENPSNKCEACRRSFRIAQGLAGHRQLAHKDRLSAQGEGAPSEPVAAAAERSRHTSSQCSTSRCRIHDTHQRRAALEHWFTIVDERQDS